MFEKIFGKIKEKLSRKESLQSSSTKKKKNKSNKKSKKNKTPAQSSVQSSTKEYPNRFLKFYHLNQKRLNQERRGSYNDRKKAGICVRCQKKAQPGIVFCEHHQTLQKGYNAKARGKS
jgi:hypothetical protein